MTIGRETKLAGVIGWPIAHSLSPRLHSYWLATHAIKGSYIPLPVARENFSTVVEALRLAGFVGLNVTVPHKEAAFALAHDLDASAHEAGAVNLLLFRKDGVIEGRNTDSTGLASSLQESIGKSALAGKPAVVLGSGGAARASVVALDHLAVSDIRIVGRNTHRAETLAQELSAKLKTPLKIYSWDQCPAAEDGAGVLVNATSGGMTNGTKLELPLGPLPASAAVCDLVYNPLQTDLLRRAQERGLRTVDGLGMLMHQAAPSFEAFFGARPNVDAALRAELEKALRNG